jgi:hypothetical protein
MNGVLTIIRQFLSPHQRFEVPEGRHKVAGGEAPSGTTGFNLKEFQALKGRHIPFAPCT